eukprot:jgi/Botrbrau1/19447/Bobra.0338s0068.1
MVSDCGPSEGISVSRHHDGLNACGLAKAELTVLREIFALGDTDHSGYISGPNVGSFIRMIGLQTNVNDARAAIRELDADGDGKIMFAEFLRTYIPSKCHQHKFLEVTTHLSGKHQVWSFRNRGQVLAPADGTRERPIH